MVKGGEVYQVIPTDNFDKNVEYYIKKKKYYNILKDIEKSYN